MPSDSALRAAWQHYRDGDWRAAALLTNERFYGAPLTRDDSLAGQVQLALALLAMGDTASAGPVIDGVMRDNPCLTLAPTAAPEYEREFDRLRPRARCDVAVRRTIVNGLLLPGYGQFSTGRSFGVFFSASSAVAMTVAAVWYSSSLAAYRDYKATPNTQRQSRCTRRRPRSAGMPAMPH
jgi:hypothetical protein